MVANSNIDDSQETFTCSHCRRTLPDSEMSDVKSLADRHYKLCDICAYITHPDGEGEEACDGSCWKEIVAHTERRKAAGID